MLLTFSTGCFDRVAHYAVATLWALYVGAQAYQVAGGECWSAQPLFSYRRPVSEEPFRAPRDFGTCIAFHPKGNWIAAGYGDGGTVVLDARSGDRIAYYNRNRDYQDPGSNMRDANMVAFYPSEEMTVATMFGQPFAGSFGPFSPRHAEFPANQDETLIFRDFKHTYSGSCSNIFTRDEIRGVATRLDTFFPACRGVLCFSDDGKLLLSTATSSMRDDVKVIEVHTGRVVFSATEIYGEQADIGPDGKYCVFARKGLIVVDHELILRMGQDRCPGSPVLETEIEGLQQAHAFVGKTDENQIVEVMGLGHLLQIVDFRILHDGRTCISGSPEGMVVVWDIQSHQVVRRFWTGQSFNRMAVDRQGPIVAVGSDEEILLFDLTCGKHVLTYTVSKAPKPVYPDVRDYRERLEGGGQHLISSFAINNNSKALVIIYRDGLIELWHWPRALQEGVCRQTIRHKSASDQK